MSVESAGPGGSRPTGADRSAPSRGLYWSRFTTDGLTDEERAWAYAAIANASFATAPLTPRLDVTVDSYLLGGVVLIHAKASPRRTERTAAMIAADGQEGLTLQLTLEGRSTGDADGRAVETGPGDLVVFDLTRPLLMVDDGPREGISLMYPRLALEAVTSEPDRLHGLVLGPERNALLAEHLRGLLPRLPMLPNTAGRALSRVALELFAVALEAPLVDEPPDDPESEARNFDRQLIRALTYIDAHLDEEALDPAGIAAALGMSRSALYKLFDASGGVAQHIWKRRLAAVHQALLNPEERRGVAELAFAWGFGSEAHFARAFRAAYGAPPSQIRREALGRG